MQQKLTEKELRMKLMQTYGRKGKPETRTRIRKEIARLKTIENAKT